MEYVRQKQMSKTFLTLPFLLSFAFIGKRSKREFVETCLRCSTIVNCGHGRMLQATLLPLARRRVPLFAKSGGTRPPMLTTPGRLRYCRCRCRCRCPITFARVENQRASHLGHFVSSPSHRSARNCCCSTAQPRLLACFMLKLSPGFGDHLSRLPAGLAYATVCPRSRPSSLIRLLQCPPRSS
jgi:hypothetical protein